jgi:hypothetical protein
MDANDRWVIEGCYADLLEAPLLRCSWLLFLNPGIDACVANARARPWEPHKYPTKNAQDATLEMLIGWIRDYGTRHDVFHWPPIALSSTVLLGRRPSSRRASQSQPSRNSVPGRYGTSAQPLGAGLGHRRSRDHRDPAVTIVRPDCDGLGDGQADGHERRNRRGDGAPPLVLAGRFERGLEAGRRRLCHPAGLKLPRQLLNERPLTSQTRPVKREGKSGLNGYRIGQ